MHLSFLPLISPWKPVHTLLSKYKLRQTIIWFDLSSAPMSWGHLLMWTAPFNKDFNMLDAEQSFSCSSARWRCNADVVLWALWICLSGLSSARPCTKALLSFNPWCQSSLQRLQAFRLAFSAYSCHLWLYLPTHFDYAFSIICSKAML